jgi:hypothetical protein
VKAVTLRNIPPKLARAIASRARKQRSSLNKTVIRMLEERAASPRRAERGKDGLYHDLDFLIGSWGVKAAGAFERELKRVRTVDPELWK